MSQIWKEEVIDTLFVHAPLPLHPEKSLEAGFHENIYYYWQRKLREAGVEIIKAGQPNGASIINTETKTKNQIPTGWAICSSSPAINNAEKSITVEINLCRLTVTPNTDMELLLKVCGTLVNIC